MIKEMRDLFQAKEEPTSEAAEQVSVLVPYPVDKAYDYKLPEGVHARPGDYVCVPLGGREVPAVVWGEAAGDVKPSKLKTVVSVYDLPPLPQVARDFTDWVAHYTMSERGSVLKMTLSVPGALEAPKGVKGYRVLEDLRNRGIEEWKELSPKQRAVMDVMTDGLARRAAEIAKLAGCGAGVVKTLALSGYLEEVEMTEAPPCAHPDFERAGPGLSDDQRAVAEVLKSYFLPSPCSGDALAFPLPEGRGRLSEAKQGEGEFKAVLLDGVTGAGKTEVYFEAVAEALRQDRQVLILLPEIALSNAFLDRFQARFGCAPALWHSHLSPAQRRRTWRGVAKGETKVVVGARSALFLPYAELGLIVVDEEHDPAYKQEDGVMYHARDMAVVRASLGKFPVVLVSATPSLETIHNAWNGRYEHLHLPDRFGGARLPDIHVIDMRLDKPERQHFISPSLGKVMAETLARGEQVLLFLNRRGYAPLTLCRSCGHRMGCPRCTAWLVEHKNSGNLHCHHCGYSQRLPKTCPECHDEDSFAACGPGVERIYEEAKGLFPEARLMMLASDTAENNTQLKEMLEQIRCGAVDIVIGTQIIAKGHHFPGLTCVGVIDADLGLSGGDLRASERTYQLLHQVAGRAGREQKPGSVYLQTFMPEHKIMQALAMPSPCSGDALAFPLPEGRGRLSEAKQGEGDKPGRDAFYEAEAFEREQAHMPPYSRLAGIIVSGRDEGQVREVAKALGRCAPQGEAIQTLGPAPAPFAMLRGKHRYRLLVNAGRSINLQKALSEWIAQVKVPSNVRVQIDVDPQSFF